MPIRCTSSGAYLSSKPSVYKCIGINPRSWALCGLCGTELASVLNQAPRDARGKYITIPAFIAAECVREHVKDLCARELNPLARMISEDAPKRAVVKRRRKSRRAST